MSGERYAEVYQDAQGLWRFRIKAMNHEVVAEGESYHNRQDAVDEVNRTFGAIEIRESE